MRGRGYVLSEQDHRALQQMMRDYRSGRFTQSVGVRVTPRAPAASPHTPLYRVTAVHTQTETCNVQRVRANGTGIAGTEVTGVAYLAEPAIGRMVVLARLGDGGGLVAIPGTPPVVLEVRTSDPESPQPGEMWFRSDLE
jgi:hypothetical protein